MTQSYPPASFSGHYQFNRGDYLALVGAMRRPSRCFRTLLVVLWLAIYVLIMGLLSQSWSQFVQAVRDLLTMHDVPFHAYVPLVVGLALIVLSPSLTKLRAGRLYGSFAIAEQHIDIALDEAGLTTSGPGRQSRMNWSLVRRMIVTPTHAFLTISRREAIVIPKRAFANDFEFAAVIALAHRKVPSVRSDSSAGT